MVKFKISDQADVVMKNTKTGEVAYQGTVQVKDMSAEDFSTTKTPKIRFVDTHYEALLPHVGKTVIIEKSIGDEHLSSREYKVLLDSEEAIVLDEITDEGKQDNE